MSSFVIFYLSSEGCNIRGFERVINIVIVKLSCMKYISFKMSAIFCFFLWNRISSYNLLIIKIYMYNVLFLKGDEVRCICYRGVWDLRFGEVNWFKFG